MIRASSAGAFDHFSCNIIQVSRVLCAVHSVIWRQTWSKTMCLNQSPKKVLPLRLQAKANRKKKTMRCQHYRTKTCLRMLLSIQPQHQRIQLYITSLHNLGARIPIWTRYDQEGRAPLYLLYRSSDPPRHLRLVLLHQVPEPLHDLRWTWSDLHHRAQQVATRHLHHEAAESAHRVAFHLVELQ